MVKMLKYDHHRWLKYKYRLDLKTDDVCMKLTDRKSYYNIINFYILELNKTQIKNRLDELDEWCQ